jgi:hypothetical protein
MASRSMGLGLSEPIFHRRSDNKPDLFFSDRIKNNLTQDFTKRVETACHYIELY